mmetsp:Transcript_115740/g.338506  ORF Transcript_115740/g.338506 Transcript_115740/m.338506 type:complete len:297 (-) Transcript_115740:120-1010(-)
MGQATAPVAFHADADSPSGDGLKSVLSEPIEAITADEFWAILAMDLRNRHWAVPGAEAAPSRGSGEGLVVLQADRFYEWVLSPELDEAEIYCFGTDATLSKLQSHGMLKVHRVPFRIEFWTLVFGQRDSGDRLKDVMTSLLRNMKSKAKCSLNVDSPTGSGLKCVLSDPIVDATLSPDMFWKQTKETLMKKAVKVLPDGGYVQMAATGNGILQSHHTYTKHIFNDDVKEVVSYTYNDVELSEESLEIVRHLRIHVKPYRLEMWMAWADKRRAGDSEKNEVLMFLKPILEQAQLMAG